VSRKPTGVHCNGTSPSLSRISKRHILKLLFVLALILFWVINGHENVRYAATRKYNHVAIEWRVPLYIREAWTFG